MRLKAVPGDRTRPIMDRVKEALFSILGSDIQGASFLDLFAGTGSVGIEALSRGADFVLFVELNPRARDVVWSNLVHTRLVKGAKLLRRDAFQILAKPPDRDYNFIYVAPPQYQGLWLKTLEALDSNPEWHQADCQVIVQLDPKEYELEHAFRHIEPVDSRTYGRTMLVFYRFV